MVQGGQDDLRVGVRAEAEPVLAQLVAQFPEVVDGAVEGDDAVPVGGDHGLAGMCGVEDGQPAMSQDEPAASPQALVVRPAVGLGVHHGPDVLFVFRPQGAPQPYHACNSAHVATFLAAALRA
jgi:hypothetical protein